MPVRRFRRPTRYARRPTRRVLRRSTRGAYVRPVSTGRRLSAVNKYYDFNGPGSGQTPATIYANGGCLVGDWNVGNNPGAMNFNDTINSVVSLGTGAVQGANTGFTRVTVGTAVTQRIGKAMAWKSIQIKGQVQSGPSQSFISPSGVGSSGINLTTSTGGNNPVQCCKLVLVWDREPNGAVVPATTDIWNATQLMPGFYNNGAGNASTYQNNGSHLATWALTNRDKAERYKIVRQWDFSLGPTLNTAGDPSSWPGCAPGIWCIDTLVKLPPYRYISEWTAADTNNTRSNLVKGDFYLVALGDQISGPVGTWPIGTFSVRINYTDQ